MGKSDEFSSIPLEDSEEEENFLESNDNLIN